MAIYHWREVIIIALISGVKRYRAERNAQTHKGVTSLKPADHKWLRHDSVRSLRLIVTNPMFMCLCLVSACEGSIVGGFGAFSAKFMQYQFKLASSLAGIYTGKIWNWLSFKISLKNLFLFIILIGLKIVEKTL